MELITGDVTFPFTEEQIQDCGYLRGLRETFGARVDCCNQNEDQIALLYRILTGAKELTLYDLPFLDLLCVDSAAYSKCLRESYDEFVYIIGEHTGITPRIDKVDLEHIEIQELKRLYFDRYYFVLNMMRLAPLFAEFERPLPDEHLGNGPQPHVEPCEKGKYTAVSKIRVTIVNEPLFREESGDDAAPRDMFASRQGRTRHAKIFHRKIRFGITRNENW